MQKLRTRFYEFPVIKFSRQQTAKQRVRLAEVKNVSLRCCQEEIHICRWDVVYFLYGYEAT